MIDHDEYMSISKFDVAIKIAKSNPGIFRKVGFASMSCAGGWGREMWKYFGAMIEKNTVDVSDPETKDFARFVADETAEKHSDDLLLNFAVAGNWTDVAAECMERGNVAANAVEAFVPRAKSSEMREILMRRI